MDFKPPSGWRRTHVQTAPKSSKKGPSGYTRYTEPDGKVFIGSDAVREHLGISYSEETVAADHALIKEFLQWRQARNNAEPVRSSTPIPPMPPCPQPELIGKVVCKKFTVYETTKDFYGRVKWDEETGQFYVQYEDDDWEHVSVDVIRRYSVTMSHFFDKIDETGNRSRKFSRFLKFLSKNSRRRARVAFRDLGLDVYLHDGIGPYLWPLLGENEEEKVAVSKKVLEYVYYN